MYKNLFPPLHICKYLILIILIVSCSEKSYNPEDPADVFAAAAEPYNDGLYDIALQKLGQFKSRFPYSKHAAQADLMMANSHFELGNYQEAAIAYSQFIKLHPRHEKVDFAQFRIGEAYWIEAPEEVDREQDFTSQAMIEWQTLLDKYSSSKYVKEAREKMKIGRKRIADSQVFVMNFYCKQEIYHACAFRAVNILESYKDFPDIQRRALQLAGKSFEEMAKIKAEDPESDKNIYFKSMTAKQLKEKAETFRSAESKLPKS